MGAGLLGLDQRVLKAVWTIFLFALVIVSIYAIRSALITFALAIFLALLLSPLVTLVDHLTSVRIPRTVSLMVVYVLLIAAFAAALIGVVSAVATDARSSERCLKHCATIRQRASAALLARSDARPLGPVDSRPFG